MKNKEKQLSDATSNSLTQEEDIVISLENRKMGRPAFTEQEQLKSDTVGALINLEDADKLFINKNSIKGKNETEAEEIRQKNSEQLKIARNIVGIEQQIETLQADSCCQSLINSQKRLSSLLSKIEHQVDDEVSQPIGKPTVPLALARERANFKYNNLLFKLNENEKVNQLQITSKQQLKELAIKRRQSNLGRSKNTELPNLDNSIKICKKKIKSINRNMLQENKVKNKRGRKRHGEEKLDEQMKILDILYEKVIDIEMSMTPKQLLKRRIAQLKSVRQGVKQKQYHAKTQFEQDSLQNQLFDIELRIIEKQKRLEHLTHLNEETTDEEIKHDKNNLSQKQPEADYSSEELNLLLERLKKALVENIELKSTLLRTVMDNESILKSA